MVKLIEDDADEDEAEAVAASGASKHRSPNYPVMALKKAIEKVSLILKDSKRHEVPLAVACASLGFKNVRSSSAIQTIAALRAFDLIQVKGSGTNRKVAVSERAARIIGDHNAKAQLIREAALMPKLHREVWAAFFKDGEGLAPDKAIHHYLIWERPEGKFSPESADAFIRQFHQTLDFAGLDKSGTMSADGPNGDEEDDSEEPSPSEPKGRQKDKGGRRMLAPGTIEDVLSCESGGAVTLSYPDRITPEEFEDFEAWWKIMLRKVKRRIAGPDEPTTDDE
jgi:hypothetical protein